MTTMRAILDLIETTERRALEEAARAPLYHATGLTIAAKILADGCFQEKPDGGWKGYDGNGVLAVTRDERYRYSGGGHNDAVGNKEVESGHGPIQFVLDADAVRQRYAINPYDMAQGRFDTIKDRDPEYAEMDPWGDWKYTENIRRKESEERIVMPKNGKLPLDGIVKAIILEPITQDWLRLHHWKEDRPHLTGSGKDREFTYAQKKVRYNDSLEPTTTFHGNDYTGVVPKIYHRIISLAKQRGIPVIDRRKK